MADPETTITCRPGEAHIWVTLPKDRHRCALCKLVIHEPKR